jgi:hypothetical protein
VLRTGGGAVSADPEPPPGPGDRARSITMVTALRPARRWLTYLNLAVARRVPSLMGVRPLRSLYSVRWSVLRAFPHNGAPQVRERLREPLLLWETNYSGLMDPYVETFVHVIGRQIRMTWGSSAGFPPEQSVAALTAYVQAGTLAPAYDYRAYPQASVRTVLAALDVAREHPFLVQAAAAGASAEEFRVVYDGFLVRRQGDL